MPTEINGLPAHLLLIHVVIAAVPLAALLVVLHAVWPAARRRLGIVTPLVAAVALVFVPITTNAGAWLERHLQASGEVEQRIRHHASLGRMLLPLVIVLFVVALALWLLSRRYDYGLIRDRVPGELPGSDVASGGGETVTAVRTRPRARLRSTVPTVPTVPIWASTVIAVVAVAVAVINVIQLYRIGDAGAQAAWHGVVPSN